MTNATQMPASAPVSPIFEFTNNVPEFEYIRQFSYTDPILSDIKIDSLRVKNLTSETQNYYGGLMQEARLKNPDVKILKFGSANPILFIVDVGGVINAFLSPNTEIDINEAEKIVALRDAGILIESYGKVPFSSNSDKHYMTYRKALSSFKGYGLGAFSNTETV